MIGNADFRGDFVAEQIRADQEQPTPASSVLSKPQSRVLEKMRQNPKGNWNISDVSKVCDQIGLTWSSPTRGSHFKITSEHLMGVLTVPAHRPIKPPYIKALLSLADAHVAAVTKGKSNGK